MLFFEASPESFHGKIPFIVTDLITELRNRHSENVEGIFRLNGSDTKTRELCDALNNGRINDWSRYTDIHTVSTSLKRYFRSMAEVEPLMTSQLYDLFIAVVQLESPDRVIQLLRKLVQEIGRVRKYTLAYLMRYLHEITENSKVNLMTAKNLGVCFGPNLLAANDIPQAEAMQHGLAVNKVVETMIEHYDEIFEGLEVGEDLLCNDEDFIEFNKPPVNLANVQYQMFRCQFRNGKIIPFVPLCRLLKKYERPTREPPRMDGEEDQVLTTMLGTLRLADDETEELMQSIRSTTGRLRSDTLASLNPPEVQI